VRERDAPALLVVQVGVVLAPFDNDKGLNVNQQICRVVRALGAGAQRADVDAEVARLNALLKGSR